MNDGKEREERTWRLTKEIYSLNVRVKAPMYDALLWILESGAYLNFSEYMIDLIRQDLKERGLKIAPIQAKEEGEEEDTRILSTLETAIVSTRVPIPILNAIEEVLKSEFYHKVSDYLRDIIQKDIEARGIKLKPEETKTGFVQAQVPIPMKEALDKLLETGLYLDATQYLRHVIKKDLEERGLLPEIKLES